MRANNSGKTLNFTEVKSVYTDNDCNSLIAAGWEILHVGATHIDTNGFNCKTTFIMGNPNTETKEQINE